MTEAALRERIDELEEENIQLKAQLYGARQSEDYFKYKRKFGMRGRGPTHVFVQLMTGKLCTREHLLNAVSKDGLDPSDECVKTYIHHIRKAMKPYDIEIETVWGVGYRMRFEMIQKVEALFTDEVAA